MKIILILGLVTMAWAFIPHAPNFSPVVAVCMLVGLWLRSAWAIAAMAALLLGQDALLALLSHSPAGGGLASFSAEASLMRAIGFVLVGLWGAGATRLFKKSSWAQWGGGFTGASLVFFLSSNFLVWWGGGLYPPTGAGLWACYVAGLPFFHHTFLSTAVFSGTGILIYNAAQQSWTSKQRAQTLKV